MSFLMTFLALGFVIFIHEMGHLLVAKWSGIGVYEFAVGMGPKLTSRKFGETEYSLRLFPFGGFVRLYGMDDTDDQPIPDELNYHKKPIYKRFLTIVAGSAMNIFLGFLVFLFMFSTFGVLKQSAVISSVIDESPALRSGIQVGDEIVKVNGEPVSHVGDDIVTFINSSLGESIQLEINRSNNRVLIDVLPEALSDDPSKGLIGVMFESDRESIGLVKSAGYAAKATVGMITQVFSSVTYLIKGKASLDDLSGPIGIIQLASVGFDKGLIQFLNIIAMISIALGVFNLFPFPVLDGGHAVFLAIEAIRQKPLSKKVEGYVTNAGMIVLVGLMVIVVVNDVINWQSRMELFNKILP